MTEAKDPESPWFIRMVQVQDTIDAARKECGCETCVGDGLLERGGSTRPCDFALEITANLMALYEHQRAQDTDASD